MKKKVPDKKVTIVWYMVQFSASHRPHEVAGAGDAGRAGEVGGVLQVHRKEKGDVHYHTRAAC